jgi:gliding motility-associated-like protein
MKSFLLLLIIFSNFVFSQSPAGIWYFGKKAGITFNAGPNPINLNGGELETDEGCATLCDGNGNLLFYTDGIKVWNRNHQVMPNGNGLKGDPSSTQSAVIVPKPGSTNLYYIFTVDELGKTNGMNYSIIDLNEDGGFGDIILKNTALFTPTLEKITAVKHSNETSVWIIGHKYNSSSFISYELSNSGLSIPVTSNVGPNFSNNTQKTIGYMKSSPNGKFIACANSGAMSSMQLFSFNNSNGHLNLISSSDFDFNGLGAYGIEFSSNSELLYVSQVDYINQLSQIFQFSIISEDETIINDSKTLISSQNYTNNSFIGLFAALQLGPDQKIYIARNNSFYLSAINNPNTIGLGCQFVENAISLQNQCKYGLPSFVTSYLELNYLVENFCFGEETNFMSPTFSAAINYEWNFNDLNSSSNISSDINPSHVFSSTGDFIVTLTVTTSTTSSVFSKLITIIDAPIANFVSDFNKCDENNNNTATFNLNTKNSEVLGMQNSSNYNIKYYSSLTEAENNGVNLPIDYINISNPQTIYVRIETLNGVCYDITSFDLIVNSLPNLGLDKTVFYCKNYAPNTITLSAGNQNSSQNLTYLWNNGATSENIQINQSGTYSVTATNLNGCSSTRSFTVNNSEIASIMSIQQGQIGDYTVNIIVSGVGAYSYALDNENGSYQFSPTFNNVAPGDHIIYVKDENGCGITSSNFSVIGYPKYFTPNNDGVHDYWQLQGKYINLTSLKIFDRYGKLIQDVTSKNGWDGKYNNQNAIATDYWFIAELASGEIIKGHFSLKR